MDIGIPVPTGWLEMIEKGSATHSTRQVNLEPSALLPSAPATTHTSCCHDICRTAARSGHHISCHTLSHSRKGMRAQRVLGYASPKRCRYHRWCCNALGPMFRTVNKAKAVAGRRRAARAQPPHSKISPKKLAPDTYSNMPPRGMEYPAVAAAKVGGGIALVKF